MVDSRESDQSGRGGISIRKSKQSFSTGKSTRPSEQDTSIHDSLLVHDEVKDGEESVEAMDSNAEDVEGEDVDTGELDITSKSQEEREARFTQHTVTQLIQFQLPGKNQHLTR